MAHGLLTSRGFSLNNNTGYAGSLSALTGLGEFNQTRFIMKQLLAQSHVAAIVQVKAVTNNGSDSPVGQVDVTPLVSMLDGQGGVIPHGTIHSLPYFRIQGGSNAVILDPEVGDIGLAVFAENDISAVKSTKSPSPPGSARRNDYADGMYFGGFLNGSPTQFVQFNSSGITVTSPASIICNAPDVTVNASASATVVSPSIILKNTGAALKTLLNSTLLTWLNSHVHGNGNGGADTTGPTTTPAASVQTSVVQAE